MIITLTPNPSIDRTITLENLRRGQVQRALESRLDPGGKGINVARALAAHGAEALAVLPIGGGLGAAMTTLLTHAGAPVRTVPIHESIRVNVAIVEPDGTTTKINEVGPRLSGAEVDALLSSVSQSIEDHTTWVVGCGSLPPGVPVDFYATLVRLVHQRGAKVAIDTAGEALAHAARAGPDLIKPNRSELEELLGRQLPTLGDVADGAKEVVRNGVGAALVSLGRDGAVLVTADDVIVASATVPAPVCTVGAGDCMLAGFLHAMTKFLTLTESLCAAVAAGAAAVGLPGTGVPTPSEIAAMVVTVEESPTTSLPLAD